MNELQALNAFASLAQETRLRIVRLLVTAGQDGMPAGAVGDAMGASSSKISFHLSHLERAGLIQSRREARSIIYSAVYPALSGLIEFLMKDCCQGRCDPTDNACAETCEA
jgi:ArsR family transcriptional regulator